MAKPPRRQKRSAMRTSKSERRGRPMVLTGADRDTFLDALQNPPEPTEKLVKAFKRHRRLVKWTVDDELRFDAAAAGLRKRTKRRKQTPSEALLREGRKER